MQKFIILFFVAVLESVAVEATAQTFTVLHTFTALDNSTNSDGVGPNALVLSGTTLYGTTEKGGSSSPGGTIFALNTDDTAFTTLYRFNGGDDGFLVNGGLILWSNALYGTTRGGGSAGDGTAFAFNSSIGYTNLHNFIDSPNNASFPYAGLILSGNTLYGTASEEFTQSDGKVFALNTDGTGYTNLHAFTGGDGISPYAKLVLSGTTLYGTTRFGGKEFNGSLSSSSGTVFALNTDSTGFTNLYSFTPIPTSPPYTNSDGGNPLAGLVVGGSTLYGATDAGGSGGLGTVFALNRNGTGFTVLHSFSGDGDGAYPTTLILSGDTLYGITHGINVGGSTSNIGTVFKVNTDGSGFTSLHSFSAIPSSPPYTNTDGANPSSLILSGNALYGTTSYGGDYGNGTVFSLFIQPQLKIIPAGPNVILTWPTNAIGFTLQSTTNLLAPVWATNSPLPVLVNGQNTVTNQISGTQQFYRLSQ